MAGTIAPLHLLPFFIAVAETRNMTAAARQLGAPKSSVSRGIAALEDALGVQLLHRTTRNISLTSAGAAFLEKARPLLASLEEAAASVSEGDGVPSGTLRLTAPEDLGVTLLPDLLARFQARYPAVQLDVRLSNRRLDLVAEAIDIALRVAMPRLSDSTLVAKLIAPLDTRVYASPEYVARRPAPRVPEDTASHDWVLMHGFKLPRPLAAPKKPRVLTDDMLFVREAVRAGSGLGVLPAFLAQSDVTEGRLVTILPRVTLPGGRLYFVHPPAEHVPRRVTAFRDFFFAHIKERPFG